MFKYRLYTQNITMKGESMKTKDITHIAISVAVLISGGYAIFFISKLFPLPGVKYLMMAPFLSIVVYVMLMKVEARLTILMMGSVFGIIMGIMNIYMGIAILMTAVLSQVCLWPVKNQKFRAYLGGMLFPGFTGLTALWVSKYMIGGIFEDISLPWVIMTGITCTLIGAISSLMARRLMRYIRAQANV